MSAANKMRKKSFSEPITDPEAIERIRSVLTGDPMKLLLFDLSIHTGIFLNTILTLQARHFLGVQIGSPIPIENAKNRFFMTAAACQSFDNYRKKVKPKTNDYLFTSKNSEKPLSISGASRMIRRWFDAADISGDFGSASLRKTWEYHQKNKALLENPPTISIPKELFKPIRTTPVQQAIFDELFKAIVTGKLLPGTRLTAAEISKAFKVSQAPVRVALNWLEAKGFIVPQKKQASIVKELSIEELNENMEIRLILEIAAAKASYKLRTEDTLRELDAIIKKIQKAKAFEEIDRLNTLFHLTMYRDANKPVLVNFIADLCYRVNPYVILYYAHKGHGPPPYHDHRPPIDNYINLLEGMRQKDIKKVLKYLKLKIRRPMAGIEELLENIKVRRLDHAEHTFSL